MPTYTTTYNLGKPVVGADEDAWGTTLNTSLDTIDDILDGTVPVTGIDINSGTLDGVTIGGTTAGAGTFTTLTATGTTILAGASTSADITFGDNDKAIFGAGSDLQIYHDGSGSFVDDQGTGGLILRGTNLFLRSSANENYLGAVADGSVTIYHDNAPKLDTTSTGIDVTGTVTADGLTVDGDITINDASPTLSLYDTDGTNQLGRVYQSGAKLIINSRDNTNFGAIDLVASNGSQTNNRLTINADGDISFYEDTGSTPKFFWDASAESLGIGTTSPSAPLHVNGGSSTGFATVKHLELGYTASRGLTISTSQVVAVDDLVTFDAPTATYGQMAFKTAGSERMRIDSSGNVILNNSPASTSDNIALRIKGGTSGYSNVQFADADDVNVGMIQYNHASNYMQFTTNDSERMRIDSSGNVGIGTSSPSQKLHVYGGGILVDNGSSAGTIYFHDTTNYINLSGDALQFANNGTERMRIDSSGNVGIGTSSPSTRLDVSTSASTIATFRVPSGGGANNKRLEVGTGGDRVIFKAYTDSDSSAAAIAFNNGATSEAMRIDSSGNLLVGTTSNTIYSSSSEAGSQIGDGYIAAARAASVAYLNRLTTDGDIVEFRKDGTTVGSIAADGGFMSIGSGDVGLAFNSSVNTIHPNNQGTLAGSDGQIDLGYTNVRFKDIYATNGTIQTSDQNEKQDISELSDAEQRVAVAAKGLLRKFRWRDAVAEKGDEARTHFGIIAQDLQAAFAAEGLDAGDYAMFIHTTWTDEETGEERSRMGVRYSELLAFIIAAI